MPLHPWLLAQLLPSVLAWRSSSVLTCRAYRLSQRHRCCCHMRRLPEAMSRAHSDRIRCASRSPLSVEHKMGSGCPSPPFEKLQRSSYGMVTVPCQGRPMDTPGAPEGVGHARETRLLVRE